MSLDAQIHPAGRARTKFTSLDGTLSQSGGFASSASMRFAANISAGFGVKRYVQMGSKSFPRNRPPVISWIATRSYAC
jgi:hypothetical protein